MCLDRSCAFTVRWSDMFYLDVPTRGLRAEVEKAQVHNDNAKLLVRHVYHLTPSETPSNASPSHLLEVSRLSHPRTDRLRNNRESMLLARFLATFFHLYHATLSWSQATKAVSALVAVRLPDAKVYCSYPVLHQRTTIRTVIPTCMVVFCVASAAFKPCKCIVLHNPFSSLL